MKIKILALSVVSAALLSSPASLFADDNDVKDKTDKAQTKVAEANRKVHEQICQGHHGAVTAKTDQTITIDGQLYALTADSRTTKQGEPLLLKTVKIGDTVCFTTQKAADGSQQISKLIAVDKDEKVRVRDRESGSPGKIEVETPNKKDEVK